MELNKSYVVTYHNKLNDIPLTMLSTIEQDIFMVICYKCKNLGPMLVPISFKEIQLLTNFKRGGPKKLLAEIEKLAKKLLAPVARTEDTDSAEIRIFNLFNEFIIKPKEEMILVEVNREFEYLLNNITNNYTAFELFEFVSIRHKQSKHVYRQLKRYKDTGVWKVTVEKFSELVGIPVQRVKKYMAAEYWPNIKADIESFFDDLDIKYTYGKTKGNPLTSIEITFTPQKHKKWGPTEIKGKFTCPQCGKPLVEKIINGNNCWCHYDGWKADAKCKAIYNSVAEIKGYKEDASAAENNITDEENQERLLALQEELGKIF